MRVQVYELQDRLYFLIPEGAPIPMTLELADGIAVERAPHGRLLLTNGKNAWVGVLRLANQLGWCRVVGDEPFPDPAGDTDP